MYLLDTNALSELRKVRNGRADLAFAQWSETVSIDLLHASVVTLFEIETGILLLDRRERVQAAILRRWFDQVKMQMEGHIVPVDADIALCCAGLNVPDPRPFRDAFIGATAFVRGYTLVTRNVRDFHGMKIDIVNPWQAPT